VQCTCTFFVVVHYRTHCNLLIAISGAPVTRVISASVSQRDAANSVAPELQALAEVGVTTRGPSIVDDDNVPGRSSIYGGAEDDSSSDSDAEGAESLDRIENVNKMKLTDGGQEEQFDEIIVGDDEKEMGTTPGVGRSNADLGHSSLVDDIVNELNERHSTVGGDAAETPESGSQSDDAIWDEPNGNDNDAVIHRLTVGTRADIEDLGHSESALVDEIVDELNELHRTVGADSGDAINALDDIVDDMETDKGFVDELVQMFPPPPQNDEMNQMMNEEEDSAGSAYSEDFIQHQMLSDQINDAEDALQTPNSPIGDTPIDHSGLL